MQYPNIIHHGAAEGVTGSCHQLELNSATSLLIDCGLFQGEEAAAHRSLHSGDSSFESVARQAKALIITHVHADHIGRLPELLAAGFKGPILCSEPSELLMPVILEDAFRIQYGHDEALINAYLGQIAERVIPVPFNHWFSLYDASDLKCRIRLQRAGHILGSAYIECDVQYPAEKREQRVVFSGDLGASDTPILKSPCSPECADVLVLESTYGDRQHEDRSSRQARLEAVIEQALADQGTILIPAFSLGRTQELLYEIEDILHRKAVSIRGEMNEPGFIGDAIDVDWPELPIILDSPLASKLTSVYEGLSDFWDEEASARSAEGRRPLSFKQLVKIDSHSDHLRVVNYLASTRRPAIVIAGGGMCSGGRIVDYLKAMLGDQRHNVLFVGYQAKGTPGAAIQQHGPAGGYVELERERYDIRAGIATLGGYSAHADQQGLVKFVTGMRSWPSHIRLVHGEAHAKKALRSVLLR
jgi:metallo-beta-lactamase family protein